MNRCLHEKQQSWIDDFALIENPVERLQALVDQTRNLSGLRPEERVECHRVEGCVSKVWLCGRVDAQGCCEFAADAESVVVQGLVRLLCHLYSGHPPEEVIAEPPRLWQALRLDRQLSPTRLHGLGQVHRRIVELATAFVAETAGVPPLSEVMDGEVRDLELQVGGKSCEQGCS